MTPKEQYYRYGELLGISINDLQRLKMLADDCQEDMAEKYTKEDIINIVKKSRETGLTAEYLILQLNNQDR